MLIYMQIVDKSAKNKIFGNFGSIFFHSENGYSITVKA